VVPDIAEIIPGFAPEGDLESTLIQEPDLITGLWWGRPRRAHPEGAVGNHVADLVCEIDRSGETGERRALLRVVALVHDSFKYAVVRWWPRTGENHHAMRARRFMERLTGDERILATIELHDRPYAIWRRAKRRGRPATQRLDAVLARIPDHALFLRFVEIDGASEAKNPEPIRWLRGEMVARGLLAA
jgi:hypothetical protein